MYYHGCFVWLCLGMATGYTSNKSLCNIQWWTNSVGDCYEKEFLFLTGCIILLLVLFNIDIALNDESSLKPDNIQLMSWNIIFCFMQWSQMSDNIRTLWIIIEWSMIVWTWNILSPMYHYEYLQNGLLIIYLKQKFLWYIILKNFNERL